MSPRRHMQGCVTAGGRKTPAGFTPARVTPRCAFCKRKFTPRRADARYCCPACRQAAYRRRRRRRARPETPPARVHVCAHCGAGFWAARPTQRYCSPSCRQLAYRARRRALERQLVAAGVPPALAAEVIERYGLRQVAAAARPWVGRVGHTTGLEV